MKWEFIYGLGLGTITNIDSFELCRANRSSNSALASRVPTIRTFVARVRWRESAQCRGHVHSVVQWQCTGFLPPPFIVFRRESCACDPRTYKNFDPFRRSVTNSASGWCACGSRHTLKRLASYRKLQTIFF